MLINRSALYEEVSSEIYYKNIKPLASNICSAKTTYLSKSVAATALVIGTNGIFDDNKTLYGESKSLYNTYVNAGGENYQLTKNIEKSAENKRFDLGNGFYIQLGLYQPYYIENIRSFAIYDGNKLIIDTNSRYGSMLSGLGYYWTQIRVTRLKGEKDRYLIVNSCGYYPPFLVENGKVTTINKTSSVLETYSLIPFKNRGKLEKAIKKLVESFNK